VPCVFYEGVAPFICQASHRSTSAWNQRKRAKYVTAPTLSQRRPNTDPTPSQHRPNTVPTPSQHRPNNTTRTHFNCIDEIHWTSLLPAFSYFSSTAHQCTHTRTRRHNYCLSCKQIPPSGPLQTLRQTQATSFLLITRPRNPFPQTSF
jgi:hypothetical protein